MPKQRNRQHHHAKSDRHGDGLQLPTVEWFFRGPRIIYPRGWKTKGPSEQIPIMFRMFFVMGIAFVALMLVAAIAAFLPH